MKNMRPRSVVGLLSVCSLVFLVACGFNGQPLITEDIGPAVDDNANISMQVKRALRKAPQTAVENIMVTQVNEYSVKLSGYVSDDATAYEAERVAGRIPGVRHVVNNLAVRQ